MKKKCAFMLCSLLLALVLTSCDEVLSVVTAGENGEKVVHSYVSMIGDKVYDESASINSWKSLDPFDGESVVNMDNLLFKIENKKENIVVFGDEEAAVEISFFDGGYKYTAFIATDALEKAMSNW